MTEGENPDMIHYSPFWTCTFKHFQQPVQEATKKLMRPLHMAFGCCSHCKPTSRTACCISGIGDSCLLGGQSTPAAPTLREPVVSVVASTKGSLGHYSHSSVTDCATQHGSVHRPLLWASYWMQRVISKVFSQKAVIISKLEMAKLCKRLASILSVFPPTSPPKFSRLLCSHKSSWRLCITCTTDCLIPCSSGRLDIWWLIRGYKSHHYTVLLL